MTMVRTSLETLGSNVTRKSVNVTRNMTQSWVNLTSLFVKSAES